MRMRPTWVLVVCSAMTRETLISALDMPRAMSVSTSASRGVSRARGSPGRGRPPAAGRGRLAKSAISRLVTDGASSASPAATTRTACTSSAAGASFSRNPLAPARSASYTYSSRSNVVSIRTRGAGSPGRSVPSSSRVAWSPSSTGMRTSIRITSGLARRASATASAPSAASPATVMPGWAVSSAPNPSRTIAWSSAIRQLITPAAPPPAASRAPRNRRPPPGPRPARRPAARPVPASRRARARSRPRAADPPPAHF